MLALTDSDSVSTSASGTGVSALGCDAAYLCRLLGACRGRQTAWLRQPDTAIDE